MHNSTANVGLTPPAQTARQSICGFTLVELMIALAVIAILASIAYPAYMDSVRKSRRSDAMVALQQIQMEQEKFRANCPYYAGNLTGLRACGANAAASSLGLSSSYSANNHYLISPPSVSGTGFSVTATAVGAQLSDTSCKSFTLAVSGLNVTTSALTSANADSSSTCWVR